MCPARRAATVLGVRSVVTFCQQVNGCNHKEEQIANAENDQLFAKSCRAVELDIKGGFP